MKTLQAMLLATMLAGFVPVDASAQGGREFNCPGCQRCAVQGCGPAPAAPTRHDPPTGDGDRIERNARYDQLQQGANAD